MSVCVNAWSIHFPAIVYNVTMKRSEAQRKADIKYRRKIKEKPLIQARVSIEEYKLFEEVYTHFKLSKKETILKAIRLLKSTI